MGSKTISSRRAFSVILLLMGLLCVLIVAAGYQGLVLISNHLKAAAMTTSDAESLKTVILWLSGFISEFKTIVTPLLAAVFFLWSLLLWLRVRHPSAQQPSALSSDPPQRREDAAAREQQDARLFLHLISTLQKEGRLLDFFSENLDAYDDAQIGAAVRSIHESCRNSVHTYLTLKPVLEQDEGAAITLQKGFDTSAIKLVGNVVGEPPFTGTVRHKGWKTTRLEIPTLSASLDASLIAPAEVEI